MMWTAVVGVLIGLGSVCCRVTVRPQNTVAIRGERMSLECRTTDGSTVYEWSFVRPSSNPAEPKTIFSNWNSQSRQLMDPGFGIEVNDHGSGILYRNETRFDDGGTFICTTDVDEKITQLRAELIVLDSKPVCSVEEYAAGSIKTECSVGFSGNWAPKMEWRHHSKGKAHEDGTVFPQGVDYYNNGTHVTSKLNAVIINSAKDSLSVSCKTFFDARGQHQSSAGAAANVPDFVHIWMSPVFGSTNIVPDVPARTTPDRFAAVSDTLSGQSTDASQSEVSDRSHHSLSGDEDDWTLILAGGGVLVIILVSLLLGTIIVCVIRKRKAKEKPTESFIGNENVIYRKKTVKANDPNIYDSILLYDEDGYRIPLQGPIDGDSHAYASPKENFEPYHFTTSAEVSTSREADTILKPQHKNETEATSTEYEKMSKPPNDRVDSGKVPNEQGLDSFKSSKANYVETGNDKAPYLQVIDDSEEDKQVGETKLSSNKGSEMASIGSAAYTRLVLESQTESGEIDYNV